MFLKRLLKWLLGIAAFLAVAALLFVWVYLDVNPFEGSIEAPWQLVSSNATFYVQFPGTRMLEAPLAEELAGRPGFETLAGLRAELARAAKEIERQLNPRIPLGLFEVDVEEDFLRRQMAIGGVVADYATMRLGYFVAVARVPFYARFVSALRRAAVREALGPIGERVELRNRYFRVQLPSETVARLAPYRAVMRRDDGDDALFFARVGDAVVVSDRAIFVEDALQPGNALRNTGIFEEVFMGRMEGGERIEAFFADGLAFNVMRSHGVGGGGRLAPIAAFLPPVMVGTVTGWAEAARDRVEVALSNKPTTNGLAQVGETVARLLDAEKGDTRFMLGAEGLGKFVPRERTVAAIAFHASAEDLRRLLVENIPVEDRRNIDDLIRDRSKHAFTGLDRLLEDLAGSLGNDHLLILHRPSLFDRADFSTFAPKEGQEDVPDGELTATLVLSVNPSVPPDNVRNMIRERLPHLDLDVSPGLDPSGKLYRAALRTKAADLRIVEPAYGTLPGGMNYVLVSSHFEGAEAVIRTAEKASEPLVADPAFADLLQRLPPKATVAGFVNPVGLKAHLADRVRKHARDTSLDVVRWQSEYRRGIEAQGREATDEEVRNAWLDFREQEYARVRRDYLDSLDALDAVGAAAFALQLGVGSDKRVDVRLVVGVPSGSEESQ